MTSFPIPSILFILLLSTANANGNFCGTFTSQCRFKLCSVGTGLPGTIARRLQLQAANVTAPPIICRRRMTDTLGYITEMGEPMTIDEEGNQVQLKDWRPEGLDTPFESNFFYPSKFESLRKSSVARKAFLGNQIEYIDKICVQIPITSFQRRDGHYEGNDTKVIETRGRQSRDCVSFIPQVAELLVEMEWDSVDDFDLKLLEPDGTIVNKNNLESPSGGKFRVDGSAEKCFSRRARKVSTGKERILYRQVSPPPGTYTLKGYHYYNCGFGSTRWRLRVTYNMKLILNETGMDDGGFSSIAFNHSFTL